MVCGVGGWVGVGVGVRSDRSLDLVRLFFDATVPRPTRAVRGTLRESSSAFFAGLCNGSDVRGWVGFVALVVRF